MRRETKSNYGLLLFGAAMPPIVDALFGPRWGLVAFVVIASVGLLLVISGRFHRERVDETETPLKRRGKFALYGAVIALAIIGAQWAIRRNQTQARSNLPSVPLPAVPPDNPTIKPIPKAPESNQTKTVRSGPPESLPKPSEHAQQNTSKTTYQGFTEASPGATLSMGGIHVLDFWPSVVAAGQIRTPWGQEIPVRCHLKESFLYCDADLWSEIGTAVSVHDNVFTVLIPTWDRNFTDDALEIVNQDRQPMLQIIRRSPSHWEVNGVFAKPNGNIDVVTENRIVLSALRPDMPPEMKMENEKAIRDARAEITPIFKYPAYQHHGEYAEK